MSHLIFNFCTKWIIEYKNWRVQIQLDSKLDFNWSPILRQVSIRFFLIFVTSELLSAKTKEFKSN